MSWHKTDLVNVIGVLESGSRPKGGVSTDTGEVMSLGGENIVQQGGVELRDVKRVPQAFYEAMTKGHLLDRDVLINKDGANTGKVGLFRDPGEGPACINEHLFLLRGEASKITQEYLYYTLLSERGQTIIRNRISGSAQPGLKSGFINNFPIDLPESTDEQEQIGGILGTLDRAIEQTDALIAKQQRIKTGLMQDLLTKGIDAHGNIRSEATHVFKDSPLGRIPVEWDAKLLKVALREADGFLQTGPFGSQLHSHEYVHEGIPVIMPQDIVSGDISLTHIARIPEVRATDLRRHRVIINDIVFSRRGDLSRAAAIDKRETGWVCGTGCFLLRVPIGKMDANWLADVYRHHQVQVQVNTNAVGSTMPSLNNTVMEQLLIAFPSVEEQRKITHFSDSADLAIKSTTEILDKLKLLKTGLMHDLLTGERRVTALLAQAVQQ